MPFAWPAGFDRVPNEDWTTQAVETLALKYDTVENHGWYKNLDPTVRDVQAFLRPGQIVVDYSGGTGIFADRLISARGDVGIVIVDASPKFLRLALEKFRREPRVAFRWIRYLKDQKRLQLVHEVLDLRVHAIVSTNAIHLYYDLPDTLRSWARILHPDGRAFVQSGNIRNPQAPAGLWIIDETVTSIHQAALRIVRNEPRYSAYRLSPERLAAYDALRAKYFLPVRPLDHYRRALVDAGFQVASVRCETIPARVDEWYDFLCVYHEGVLGWIGGAEKIEGRPPSEESVCDRLSILRQAMREVFGDAPEFKCCWTYITCTIQP